MNRTFRTPALAYVGLTIVQIAIAYCLPTLADEAYYQAWGRRLELGYFDHPPMVAWLAHVLPPRVASLLCLHCGLIFLTGAAKRMGLQYALWCPVVVLSCPLGMVGGVIYTPDAPLFLFWSAFVYLLACRSLLGMSVALALCMWTKLSIWPAILGLGYVLGIRKAAFVVSSAVLLYLPHLFWSADNQWLPWSHQASRPVSGLHFIEAALGQVLVVGPVVFWAGMRSIFGPKTPLQTRMRPLVLPSLVLWFAASFFTRVEANWFLLGWIPAILLAVELFQGALRKWAIVYGVATAVTALSLLCLAHSLGGTAGPPRLSDDFKSCAAYASTRGPVTVLRYQEAALLAHLEKPFTYVRPEGRRASQYDRWGRAEEFAGRLNLMAPVRERQSIAKTR